MLKVIDKWLSETLQLLANAAFNTKRFCMSNKLKSEITFCELRYHMSHLQIPRRQLLKIFRYFNAFYVIRDFLETTQLRVKTTARYKTRLVCI